jgi:hypothetical protein
MRNGPLHYLQQPAPAFESCRYRARHASEDKPAVRDYASRLAEAGFTVWFDEEVLLPGQDLDVEIREAIERSCAVIVFLSARTQKRGTFKRKLRACLTNPNASPKAQFFLIPVKLEPCEVPSRLSRWQWVDLASAAGFKRLCKALDTHRVKRT